MIFEKKTDRENELRLMQRFLINFHPKTFEAVKLPQFELDFMLTNESNVVAFVEIKNYNKTFEDCDSILISMKNKYPKLLNYNSFKPTYFLVGFSCGKIAYAKVDDLNGEIRLGGRKPREGSSNDIEEIMFVDKKIFKVID